MPAAKPLPPNPQSLIPNPWPPAKDPSRISGMFDAIAGRYDFLNHLLSAGLDKRWRRQAVDGAAVDGARDRARSLHRHGDLALAAMTGQRRARRVVGIDFSAAMLRIGKTKIAGTWHYV